MTRRRQVYIVNPAGQQRVISLAVAQRFVSTGAAHWTADGKIKFRRTQPAVERSNSDAYIGSKVIFWNGSSQYGQHRPGEVRC